MPYALIKVCIENALLRTTAAGGTGVTDADSVWMQSTEHGTTGRDHGMRREWHSEKDIRD